MLVYRQLNKNIKHLFIFLLDYSKHSVYYYFTDNKKAPSFRRTGTFTQ